MKKTVQKEKSILSEKYKELVKIWLTPILTGAIVLVLLIISLIFRRTVATYPAQTPDTQAQTLLSEDNISLPTPEYRSSYSIESVLKSRRTRLDYQDTSLSLKQISQLLWSAQGVNTDWGDRTAPSSKSTYPLTIYLIANKVDGLDPGEYQYIPGDRALVHQLKPIKKVELKDAIFDLLNQNSFKNIPAIFLVTGDFSKMADAYGGIPHDKEVYLEAGYAAENLSLQAESLKLGAMVSTNFDELKLKELVTVSDTDTIIYLMPVGVPK